MYVEEAGSSGIGLGPTLFEIPDAAKRSKK